MRPARMVPPLGLAAALAACSAPEPGRDVAYYRGHANDRAAKLAACRADPGRFQRSANCVNAVAADGHMESQRFWGVSKPAPRVARPGAL
jgi:hypothetical protein